MIHKRLLVAVMTLTIGVTALVAESITGTVRDASGEPLIGVSVVVEGTSLGTITDFDGAYTIEASSDNTLVFSYVGYASKKEVVGARNTISVTLSEDTKVLSDVVVVGYATQRKANLTGAVASVNVQDQLEGRPITNIAQGLQGSTPGLTITATSGRLGENQTFRIRGQVGSLNNTSAGPLMLLNGVEISDFSLVNPDDIESISVLKDASSSSIYGARAAFGVILITTKDGSNLKDKFSVSYSNNFSWSRPTVMPKMVKGWQAADMRLKSWRSQPGHESDASVAGDLGVGVTDELVQRLKDWDAQYGGQDLGEEMVLDRDFYLVGKKAYFIRQYDPIDMYYNNTAFSNQHNLSVDATSGNTVYHIGLGYMDQKGLLSLNTNDLERYTINFRTQTNLGKYVKVRSEALYSHKRLTLPNYPSGTYNELYYMYRWPSYMPYGTYQVTDADVTKYPFLEQWNDGHAYPFKNAATELDAGYTKVNKQDYLRLSLGATFVLGIPDLTLDVDYTYNLDNEFNSLSGGKIGPAWNFWSMNLKLADNIGPAWDDWYSAARKVYYRQYHAGNAVLRYNHTWNDAHTLGVFVGMNIEHKEMQYTASWAGRLLDDNHPEQNLTDGTYTALLDPDSPGSYTPHSAWSVMGVFARINYNYKNRYLLELNGRWDGSSKFPTDQQWGFFPSGSLGWVLSEENFWEGIKKAWSFAKIRASYGSIGNQDVGSNMFRALLSLETTNWIYNGSKQQGFTLPTVLRDGFSWEKIKTTDVGVDFRFLNDDLGASFDWYQRINDGMIVNGDVVPDTYGASAPKANAGKLRTRGWELSLDYHHLFNNGIKLLVSAGVSDATTKVLKYPVKSTGVIATENSQFQSLYEGGTVGDIWGFKVDRLFQESDFHRDGVTGDLVLNDGIPSQAYFENQTGKYVFQPGDVKFVDADGDGEIGWGDKTYENHGDLRVIGNTAPHYEYNFKVGAEWKGVDINLFFQGVGKRDYWGAGWLVHPGFKAGSGSFFEHQLDYWTPENTDAYYPRLTYLNEKHGLSRGAFNQITNDRYLLNYAYLRFKNLTVGYSLPTKVLQKMHFQKFRIYFSAENLATADHLKVPVDPETGESAGNGKSAGYGSNNPFSKSFSFGIQITL